jgi:hypothetical protein
MKILPHRQPGYQAGIEEGLPLIPKNETKPVTSR